MQLPRIDPRDPVPLWRQLEDSVRQLVTGGVWLPNASAPSVRTLAAELLVNPATVAKAYQRLVDAGVLVVRRGEGTFVAPRPPVLSPRERVRALRDAAEKYAAAAAAVGADPAEAIAALQPFLATPQRATGGGKR